MFSFWNRQEAARLASLEDAVTRAESQLAALADSERRARLELVEVSEKVYRWMKRAEAAARRGAPAEPEPPAISVETPLQVPPAPARRSVWGARARIALRRHAGPAPQLPDLEVETEEGESPNGVH